MRVNELGLVLTQVVRLLERERIPYMVIGGFANLVWGEPRTTMDLDVTVDVAGIGLSAFARLAAEIGDPLPDDPFSFAERTRVLPVRTHEGVTVDFILATVPFEFDAIGRARMVQLDEARVAICAPEDLIVNKIVSERARDHEDIVGVLRRQGASLEMTNLDRIVEGLAADLGQPDIARRYQTAKRAAGRPWKGRLQSS